VANYHISYILTGRVFYLPFTIIALFWGGIVTKIRNTTAGANRWFRLAPLLCIAAYLHALLFLYNKTDFMGLSVMHDGMQSFPQPWNPYAGNNALWFLCAALVVIAGVLVRSLHLRGSPSESGIFPE
jgi:hypothetical protein